MRRAPYVRPQAGKRGGARETEWREEIEPAAGNREGTEGGAGNRGRPLAIDAIWEGNGES